MKRKALFAIICGLVLLSVCSSPASAWTMDEASADYTDDTVTAAVPNYQNFDHNRAMHGNTLTIEVPVMFDFSGATENIEYYGGFHLEYRVWLGQWVVWEEVNFHNLNYPFTDWSDITTEEEESDTLKLEYDVTNDPQFKTYRFRVLVYAVIFAEEPDNDDDWDEFVVTII